MKKVATSPARALLSIAGTLFWVLVLMGGFMQNNYLIGSAMVLFFVSTVSVITLKLRAHSAQKAEQLRLWSQGTPGRAKVITISTNGGSINDNPYVDFELEITIPGQESYQASITALVSKLAIPRIQPDCQINVRVDPNNKMHLVIDPSLTL